MTSIAPATGSRAKESLPRLMVVATHPVQYLTPLLDTLGAELALDLVVLYAFLPTPKEQGIGFGRQFAWDLPLLDGHRWRRIEALKRSRGGPHGFGALSAPRIKEQIAHERPSAVLVTGWHSRVLLQAARASRRLGLPTLVRGESNDLRLRPWWVSLAHRLLLRQFDAYLAIGEASRRFYLKAGVAPSRIHRSPYAVDNQRFVVAARRARGRRAELRRRWELPEDAFVFLFAGKLEAKKRPLDLIAALALARSAGSQAHALVVGSGELGEEMERRARAEGVPAHFAGFLNQTEIPEAYAAADALVLPSDAGETWGLVVNESMASGLPAVVSDLVGCREDLVVEGSTGYSMPMGDRVRLGEILGAMAADAEAAREMGDRAQRRVLEHYSIEAAARGILDAMA